MEQNSSDEGCQCWQAHRSPFLQVPIHGTSASFAQKLLERRAACVELIDELCSFPLSISFNHAMPLRPSPPHVAASLKLSTGYIAWYGRACCRLLAVFHARSQCGSTSSVCGAILCAVERAGSRLMWPPPPLSQFWAASPAR